MDQSPEEREPILLPQHELNKRFDELEMLKFLKDTCDLRKIDAPKVTFPVTGVTSSVPNMQHRWNAWRGEAFIRKSDSECMCILHWKKRLTGDEARIIEMFIAPDGQVYAHDLSAQPAPGYVVKS